MGLSLVGGVFGLAVVLTACEGERRGAPRVDMPPVVADSGVREADGGTPPARGDAGPGDSGASVDSGSPRTESSCPREPADPNRVRSVVVSHPFADNMGTDSTSYEVLELDTEGDLTATGVFFELGTSTRGQIVFTDDGEVGLVAQKDGSIGVFRLGGERPIPVHANYRGDFYAHRVVMDPSGDFAWVLDSQWRRNGGGVYRIDLDCDGQIIGERLVAPSKLPYGMVPRPDGTALLVARDVYDVPEAASLDAHVIDLEGEAAVAGVSAFADDDWIVASAEVTADGRHFLFGDNAAFGDFPNRIGVVAVDGNDLFFRQVLSPVEDPVALVASPFNDVVLVSSGFEDAILVLDYDPGNIEAPFSVRGELVYAEGRPPLPADAVMVRRGPLQGLVLVLENLGIRRVRFEGDGEVTDLGSFSLGEGSLALAGSIGVQP